MNSEDETISPETLGIQMYFNLMWKQTVIGKHKLTLG